MYISKIRELEKINTICIPFMEVTVTRNLLRKLTGGVRVRRNSFQGDNSGV